MDVLGKTLVFTGTMKKPRREVEKLARQMGCKVSHRVSRSTDYLVAGSGGWESEKAKDARRLGVEVVSAAKFFAM